MASDKDLLREIRNYISCDPATGLLRWLMRPTAKGNVKAGDIAGSKTHGYLRVCFRGHKIPAHHLCWALHYGEWPNGELDHINGKRSDNRIVNLRLASTSQNHANKGRQKNNKTGYKGVHFNKERGLYVAQISVDGRNRFLGRFQTADLAYAAYKDAARTIYGEFANV